MSGADPDDCWPPCCGGAGCPECLSVREDDDAEGSLDFADPGGRSALRAATARNPRNLPCPNCGRPNRLTPKDRALGYQCDACADAAEGFGP